MGTVTGCIIAARMGSRRCPGKVMRRLGDRSMLGHVVAAAKAAERVGKVVVVRTPDESDVEIEQECGRLGVECMVGGGNRDLLRDYYVAARGFGFDPVVRLTGDSPLVSPRVIDACVDTYLLGCDYCSNAANMGERTFPRGLDTEVFSFAVLEWMHLNLTPEHTPYGRYHPDYRKHVTFYIRENPAAFTVRHVRLDAQRLRLCVDTEEDYRKMREVFERMEGRPTWLKAMDVLEERPELAVHEGEGAQTKMKWRMW